MLLYELGPPEIPHRDAAKYGKIHLTSVLIYLVVQSHFEGVLLNQNLRYHNSWSEKVKTPSKVRAMQHVLRSPLNENYSWFIEWMRCITLRTFRVPVEYKNLLSFKQLGEVSKQVGSDIDWSSEQI